MSEEKKCLHCSEIIKGRTDKKFCDDQCRSSYNRQHKGDVNLGYVKGINAVLKKNRLILIELNPTGKTTIPYMELLKKGFDFSYFTSILKTGPNSHYFFCYEMGYLKINKEYVLLVKNEKHERMEGGKVRD